MIKIDIIMYALDTQIMQMYTNIAHIFSAKTKPVFLVNNYKI